MCQCFAKIVLEIDFNVICHDRLDNLLSKVDNLNEYRLRYVYEYVIKPPLVFISILEGHDDREEKLRIDFYNTTFFTI